ELFRYNLKRNLYFYFLVQVEVGHVFTQYLGFFFEGNTTTVYFKALLFEGIGYLDAVYRPEDLAGFASLSTDGQLQTFELGSQFTGIFLDFLLLELCLADVLCQHLLCRGRGQFSKSLRDEVVAAISGLHRYDVVLFAKFLDVLL